MDIKPVRPHSVKTGEGRIEFLAAIVRHARTVTLDEPVTPGAPVTADVDRIIPLGRLDLRQELGLQNVAHESFARRDYALPFDIVHSERPRRVLPRLLNL